MFATLRSWVERRSFFLAHLLFAFFAFLEHPSTILNNSNAKPQKNYLANNLENVEAKTGDQKEECSSLFVEKNYVTTVGNISESNFPNRTFGNTSCETSTSSLPKSCTQSRGGENGYQSEGDSVGNMGNIIAFFILLLKN